MRKRNKKILNSAIWEKSKRYSFKNVTNYIKRGQSKSLMRVHEVDNDNKIVKSCIGKEVIEREFIKHSRKHVIESIK